MTEIFENRAHAGRVLADRLQHLSTLDVLVLGLARGGVPVAVQVAMALDAEVDVYLVRKLGVPGREELAMGAIAESGEIVLNEEVIGKLGIPADVIDRAADREMQEILRRRALYRPDSPAADPRGRVCVLADDGLATGATMRAAALAVRKAEPSRIVVAAPVAAAPTCAAMRDVADEVVCAHTPLDFYAVGAWYRDFTQVTDDDIISLLQQRP